MAEQRDELDDIRKGNPKMNGKKMIARTALLFASAILLCIHCTTVYALKADSGQEWRVEEVEAFARDFFESHTEKDFEKAREQVSEDDTSLYAIRMEIFFELGLQKYDNITVKAYPMKKKNYWMAVVEYEAFFEGMDIGIPGSITVLVQRQEDGQRKILLDCPEDLYEEAIQIVEAEEIIEWFNEVNTKYNETMEENPEILNWLAEFSVSFDRALLSAMESGETGKIENESGDDGSSVTEENDSEPGDNDIYIVQKGDCLWSIAQKEFGNGMLWNKLYEKNRDVIGDDPNLLFIGIQLKTDEIF